MKPLVLTLRQTPEQRLDMSPLVPHRLAGKTAADIAEIELQTTRVRVTVGDIFRLRMGEPRQIRIENACERLDWIGQDMTDGEILVEGNVGIQAGRTMRGGRLTIAGDAGPWAASAMIGGTLEITGNAGDRLGGPLAGEMTGMRGGIVIVRGHAGERAGDRLRRGTILVEGGAGRYAGCRMVAGTLVARRKVGPLPGYLMRRGTIVLGEGSAALSPTFVDCGLHDLLALRIMASFVETYSPRLASVIRQPRRRFAGDMAVTGKGEIFTPA
ncbi:MAG: formylmethanofuran dehydrogenase subunit C [Xanthobacteraceae bacterium]